MQARNSWKIVPVAVLGLVFSFLAAAPPATAASWPSSCRAGFMPYVANEGSYAICEKGGGKFQAVVACTPKFGGDRVFRYGSWKKPGPNSTSGAVCPAYTMYAYSGWNLMAG